MKVSAFLVLCALALAQGSRIQLTASGRVCNCDPGQADNVCRQSTSEGYLIVHENCNQFYKCVHGQPVTQTCNGGLLYDPIQERCEWPNTVDCGTRPIVEIAPAPEQPEEDNDNGGGRPCNCDPKEAPTICSKAGSEGVLIAHENCNQFYQCNHGVPVTQTCSSGLVYEAYIQRCEWPNNVDCGGRPIVEIEAGGNNGNSGEQNPDEDCGGWSCYCDPAEAPAICAIDGNNGEIVAHENCNKFYQCVHGKPVALVCQNDLLFNINTGRCDWPHNVNCRERPVAEIDEDGSGGSEGSEGGGSGGGTCNCNPGEAPGICAGDDSDGVLVAHENCNQFYKCAHGIPVTQTCYHGLVYNPYHERCDWPNNVDCGDRPIVEIELPGNQSGEDCEDSNESGGSGSSGGGSEGGGGGTCNCNPGEAPGICSADGSDGVLVAHENCNQFYKCDNGKPVTLDCPDGLFYEPHIQRCDWPANVDCGDRPIVEIDNGGDGSEDGGNGGEGGSGGGSEGGGSEGGGSGGGTCNCNPGEAPSICSADGSDGVLVAHENCNQFYKCDNGKPVTLDCPDGLFYEPHIQRCDWPANVDCGDRPIVEIDNGGDGSEDGGNGGEGGSGGGSEGGGSEGGGSGGGTCNCNPGEAPGICSADGSDGVLVAHENCNQFYKCDNGKPVTLDCPDGLFYEPHIQRCDWPANVDCGDRPIVEIDNGGDGSEDGGNGGEGGSGGGSEGGGSEGGGSGGGTCNCNPGEAPGICSADGSDGVLVAHENCNQFYKCDNGKPVTLDCPDGLFYEPHIQRCDWPANVDCGDRPIVEIDNGGDGSEDGGNGGEGGSGGGSEGGGSEGGGSGGGTCNCNPGEAPGICSADGSDGVLVAHENCNQFYKCDNGKPVTLDCPDGLFYEPHIQHCDWPANVDCGDRPIVEIDNGGDGSEDGGNGGEGGSGGGSEGGGSEGGGSGGGTCNCNPGEAPGICSADGSDGVLVAHENCNQFYKCDNGKPVTLDCPDGLFYEPHIQRCDWPANVDCGDRPIVEIDNGGDGSEDGGNGGEGGSGGGSEGGGSEGGGSGGGTCNCNPGEAPGICSADGSDGVLVAHENCNQFYKCDNGKPVTLDCPDGLFYEPHIQRCDWPANVDCGDRPIVEIDNGGDGSEDGGNGGEGGSGGGSEGGGSEGGGSGGGTCNCNPGEAPGICSADGSDGVLVAHENCNQFYKCDNGKPVTLDCPDGLFYEPHIQHCDWPANVDCGDRPIVEIDNGGNGSEDGGNGGEGGSGGGSEGGGSEGGGSGGGTCNCNPGEAPGICSADGSDGVLVAHENCNQFYKCDNGKPVTLDCPDGLFYEPHIQRCDWPANVDCGDRPIVEIDNGGDGSEDGGNGGVGGSGGGSEGGDDNDNEDEECEENTDGTCNCNPSDAEAICQASGSQGSFVAHENCNQFYICSNGQPVTQNCPAGLLYRPLMQRCDWPHFVECGDRPILEIENQSDESDGDGDGEDNGNSCNCNPAEAPSICAADNSDSALVAHEKCNYFYKCSLGKPVAFKCNGDLLYNPYTRACDWPQNVQCENRIISDSSEEQEKEESEEKTIDGHCDPSQAPAICAADGSENVLVAHENCNKFYVCNGRLPVEVRCATNLLYNPAIEQCDWPQNVDCGDRTIPEPETPGGECACDSRLARSLCAGNNSNGKFVAHEKCDHFYVCVGGIPTEFSCPAGLFYEPYSQSCNWPYAVSCDGREVTSLYSFSKHLGARRGIF